MILALAVALLLAMAGVRGHVVVLRALFAALAIVYSVSMGRIVSFSLTGVRNRRLRDKIRNSLSHARNMLSLDFVLSTLVSLVALSWDTTSLRYTFGYVVIDIMLVGIMFVTFSLLYEYYNFCQLHKLHTDIEDAVDREKASGGD